jgi:hypothetical protein
MCLFLQTKLIWRRCYSSSLLNSHQQQQQSLQHKSCRGSHSSQAAASSNSGMQVHLLTSSRPRSSHSRQHLQKCCQLKLRLDEQDEQQLSASLLQTL